MYAKGKEEKKGESRTFSPCKVELREAIRRKSTRVCSKTRKTSPSHAGEKKEIEKKRRVFKKKRKKLER
jgi:hypothetical protein